MGLVRAALSNRAWSTVTSKSPASQKANSDSDSPVDHGKETPQLVATDETPWIEEVETPAVFVNLHCQVLGVHKHQAFTKLTSSLNS